MESEVDSEIEPEMESEMEPNRAPYPNRSRIYAVRCIS